MSIQTSVQRDLRLTEVARSGADGRFGWSDLPRAAKAFRVAHAAWGAVGLAGLGYVWLSAIKRQRDRWLAAFVAFLGAEGLALVIGRGNCPFGSFQRGLGDPVPMFELVLPPRAAKAAVPILTIVTLAGFAALLLRPKEGPSSDSSCRSSRPTSAQRDLL